MKRTLAILMTAACLCAVLTACGTPAGENVSGAESASAAPSSMTDGQITLDLSFGQKTGAYTGPLNENGLPEGHGTFVTQNNSGMTWTYVGEFVNGHFEGEGRVDWEDGSFERGVYHEDTLLPMEGVSLEEVCGDPDPYEGCCLEFTGKVFYVGDGDGQPFIQVNAMEGEKTFNTLAILNDGPADGIEFGDYVRFCGTVHGNYEYESAGGDRLTALLVETERVERLSYEEAMAPARRTAEVGDTVTQYGYSVTLEKVEFADNETRLFLRAENRGTSKIRLYQYMSAILQDGELYIRQDNYQSELPELESELEPGEETQGVIAFPTLDADKEFDYLLDGRSEGTDEPFETFVLTYTP